MGNVTLTKEYFHNVLVAVTGILYYSSLFFADVLQLAFEPSFGQ